MLPGPAGTGVRCRYHPGRSHIGRYRPHGAVRLRRRRHRLHRRIGRSGGQALCGDNHPVAGAKVILVPVDRVCSPILRKRAAGADPQAVADADGGYRLTGVPAGIYTLSAAGVDLLTGAAYRDSLVVTAAGLAEGRYRVRFLSTIAAYRPLDTVFTIRSGSTDSLSEALQLPFTGIPAISGLQAVWRSAIQAVDLSWLPADTARVAGYNVYRALKGLPLGSQPLNPSPVTVTAFRDSNVELGKEYAYAVKGVDRNGNIGLAFSETVFSSAETEFVLSKTLIPEAWTPDPAPLAVAGGEIYWLANDRVDVLDTAQGGILRSFGDSDADALAHGSVIRILRDTVYVDDLMDSTGPAPKFGASELKRYTRAGA